MKKLLYSFIALATLLFAASCQQEPTVVGGGEAVEATFSVNLGGLQTKAYSDGTTATKLQVLVYNSKGYLENVSQLDSTINISRQVKLKLVKGENYDIVFWAQSQSINDATPYYTFDKKNAKVTVNNTGLANDENRDAFYALHTTGVVTGPINETINLKRPFAQINVLDTIEDWNAAVDNGIVFTGSSMSIKAPSVLDLKNGAVSDSLVYNYTVNAITVDNPNIEGFEDEGTTAKYKYIAMNYILAGTEKANETVDFAWYRDNETSPLDAASVPNVPFQRNYRTILVGNIFSVDGVFQVIIKPEYDGSYVVPIEGAKQTITVAATSDLAQADGFTFDASSLTGTASVAVDGTLDFSSVASGESPFKPVYSSSDPTVGTIDENGKFTAIKAGTTVITIHYNAVVNGVQQTKADEPLNLATSETKFTVTVTAPVVEPIKYTVTIDSGLTGGTIEADETTAAAEDIVLLTITPAAGYHYVAGSVTVTDVAFADMQEEITATDITVAFPMPAKDVTVSATFELDETPATAGTLENPFTVAQVREYIDGLNGATSTDDVYVTGVISSIKYTFNSSFGTATFTMTADGQASDVNFVAYGAYYHAHNQMWTDTDTQVAIGDNVVVCGKVLKYTDGTYETSNKNGYVVSIVRGAPTFAATINNTDEVSANGGTKTITITGNVDWTIVADEGLTLSAASGFGAGTVTVTVPANTSTENGKTWNVSAKTLVEVTTPSYPFTITQAKKSTTAPTELEVSFDQDALAGAAAGSTSVAMNEYISFTNSSNYGTTVPTELRVYKSATLTFSAVSGYSITKIEFTCTANGTTKQGPGCFGAGAPSGYTFESDGKNGTWTGNDSSVSFTATDNQVRITALKVTYVAE